MDVTDFNWLLSPNGAAWLAESQNWQQAGETEFAIASKLRSKISPSQAIAVTSTLALREKAKGKFGDLAQLMFFTKPGLEQATRLRVGRHRAARLKTTQLNSIIDLGCGIGGDLITFAEVGFTSAGVDLDPVHAAISKANLVALDLPGATITANATSIDLAPFDICFADPARRSGGSRKFNPADWQPDWNFVTQLLTNTACVKAAPGINHKLIPKQVEAEWVSDQGELKEAVLWSANLATCSRRATVLGVSGLATITEAEDPKIVETSPAKEYIYEPDDAVIRAGLVTAVAAEVGGNLLDEKIAYVTSDQICETPFARGYRVLSELPFREKQLKAELVKRNIGDLTIKKRGVDLVPAQLIKRLNLTGELSAKVLMARVGTGVSCYLIESL